MAATGTTILTVDDEPAQRQLIRAALQKVYTVVAAASGGEAQQLLSSQSFELVITDQRMPGIDGIELLRWIKERFPEIPVILLTAYGSIDSAVEAVKLGAEDYLTKPLKSPDELRLIVSRTLQKQRLERRDQLHREEREIEFPNDIVAESPAMKQVLRLAAQVAAQPTTVLLTGESGTGKEVVARFIHRESDRSAEAFVAVNCAALTETLLESELFGHEKGAFTGAIQSRQGRFELANGGTLFLDEIGEMGANLQSKLLRVLQERCFERVGGVRSICVDVRVIAATNQDLQHAIGEKTFREDLFYRLNVFPIELPPLRQRPADILPLAEYFLGRVSRRMKKPLRGFTKAAEELLLSHRWPGNIRELQNAVERAVIVCADDEIEPDHFGLLRSSTPAATAPATLADLEKEAILASLHRNDGDRRATARELGISLRTLQYRLKDYGLAGRSS